LQNGSPWGTVAEARHRLKRVQLLALAGALAGFLVLGVGGRLLMRAVAYTTAEPPRFSLVGTLEVMGLGMLWGAGTAPLLLLLGNAGSTRPGATGIIHGLLVLAVAVLVFLGFTGGGGNVVAPPLFVISSAIVFPLLFVAHGYVLIALVTRWTRPQEHR
jgi:hypothetical protein